MGGQIEEFEFKPVSDGDDSLETDKLGVGSRLGLVAAMAAMIGPVMRTPEIDGEEIGEPEDITNTVIPGVD